MDNRRRRTKSKTDLRFLQEFADAAYPGHQGGELVIWLPERNKAVLPIRVYLRDFHDDEAPAPDQLSEIESDTIEALRTLEPGAKLTGEDLAVRANYPFNGRFREVLAGLVRRGIIKNKRPGYSL